MRSIPASIPLPRIRRHQRRLRPQSSGIIRRTAVKIKLRFSRGASMGKSGIAARGAVDVLCLVAAFAARALNAGALHIVRFLSLVASGLVHAGRPAVKAFSAAILLAEAATLKTKEFVIWHRDRRHSRGAPMLCMAAFTCLLFTAGYFGLALEVRLNGEPIGFVTSREAVSQLVQEVEDRAGEYLGTTMVLSPDITYSLRLMQADNMLDGEQFKNTLFTALSESDSSVYLLRVDGVVIGGNTSRAVLENMLGRVLNVQTAQFDQMRTEFVQEISIEASGNTGIDLGSIAEMEAMLTSNSQEMQVYSVKSGDTVSGIAKKYGMTVSEIRAMNPDLNIDKISIGDPIKISAAVPFISIRQTRTESYKEDIPFETVVEYSDSMYVNQSKITVAGVTGLADVVADVSYVDGNEESREVLEYTVLSEPSAQVKVVGTKALPAKAATGSFIKPSNGKYSSGYGHRKSMGDFHTGVDFAGKVGTSIWAADGGTVTFAGWKGNYGYCVTIDHGNGFQTLYAHCSSLLVKKGQKVAKQEVIAKVGNTGRSTGPHVHFEVIKNGKQVNPLNYISK